MGKKNVGFTRLEKSRYIKLMGICCPYCGGRDTVTLSTDITGFAPDIRALVECEDCG